MNEREWQWPARDGKAVFARRWAPEEDNDVQAVVVLIHGKGEHSGRYRHLAENFTADGYAVLAFDQLGHGLTEGKRGHADSYEELMDGIDRLLEEANARYPGKPIFLYGHSMGGNIMINYVLRRQPRLTGAIATGPWLKLAASDRPLPLVILSRVAKQMKRRRPPAPPVYLTSDPDMLARLVADPLGHAKFSAKLFFAIRRAGLWALEHANELSIPMLILHGGDDTVTAPEASRQFAERAGRLCTYREWPGLRHELHNERNREQIFAAVKAWMQDQSSVSAGRSGS